MEKVTWFNAINPNTLANLDREIKVYEVLTRKKYDLLTKVKRQVNKESKRCDTQTGPSTYCTPMIPDQFTLFVLVILRNCV